MENKTDKRLPEKTFKRLDEATRCLQCEHHYHDPRTLSCGHSFCRKCIAKLAIKKSVSCFKCEKSSHVPYGDTRKLMKNFTLADLVNSSTNPYSQMSIRCAGCMVYDSREAVEHCQTCNKSLCSLCSESHVKSRHKVVTLEEYENESMHVRDKMTDSLVSRTAVKKLALEQRKKLVYTQMARVETASGRLKRDAQQDFEKHFNRLKEIRDEICDEVNEREDFLKSKLHMVEQFVQSYSDTISKITTKLMLNNQKRLHGPVLENHIGLCQELEKLLQDDLDVDFVRETSAYAEGFKYRANEPVTMGALEQATSLEWRLKFDVAAIQLHNSMEEAPKSGAVRCMCATPDGQITIGFSRNFGGVRALCPSGEWSRRVNAPGVLVRSIGYLPDGRCAVLNTDNKISLYNTAKEKLSFEFETLTNVSGGVAQICVDEQHAIYVAYKSAKRIQIFSPRGGPPQAEITFKNIEPIDIRVSQSGSLFLVSWRKIQMLNLKGDVICELEHNSSSELIVADVCRDDTVIVAFVKHSGSTDGMDLLTIRRYVQTPGFQVKETLVKDCPIEISVMPFYCIRELVTGEICFATRDRVYFFQKPVLVVNDGGFDDYEICTIKGPINQE